MADRGTSNSPNTRNPERPPAKPGKRLEQFADDLFDHESSGGEVMASELDVTSHREARNQRRAPAPHNQ